MSAPSTNGSNGDRDACGRFQAGNQGGPGNPHAKKVARLRAALVRAVSEEDIRTIVSALVQKAKDGDIAAAREILDRCVGKSAPALDPDRLSLATRKLELDEERVELAADRLALSD